MKKQAQNHFWKIGRYILVLMIFNNSPPKGFVFTLFL